MLHVLLQTSLLEMLTTDFHICSVNELCFGDMCESVFKAGVKEGLDTRLSTKLLVTWTIPSIPPP